MYASYSNVSVKNGKTLTPTQTGTFWLTALDWAFYATLDQNIIFIKKTL